MAQSADAATVMDVDGVSTVLAISDYEGTITVQWINQNQMRGEDYEPRAASYILLKWYFELRFSADRKYAGNITIELK